MRRLTFLVALCLCLAGCGEREETIPGESTPGATIALDFVPNAVHAGIYEARRGGAPLKPLVAHQHQKLGLRLVHRGGRIEAGGAVLDREQAVAGEVGACRQLGSFKPFRAQALHWIAVDQFELCHEPPLLTMACGGRQPEDEIGRVNPFHGTVMAPISGASGA